VIGACYDGPFGIDLARDGPHGLVAGTTGAGKSELLQTLIASLACANRPDEMTFVLVDYKGGSAFAGCVHLPHVTGMVTDLDAHLTQRALASLSAELTRREHILAAAGAKDIEEYTERAGHQPRRRPLPRLVIVIDEFASLVRDLPDALLPLADLPHCGAVVTRTQDERAARLLARLGAELTRRQDLRAAGGFAGIADRPGSPSPTPGGCARRGPARCGGWPASAATSCPRSAPTWAPGRPRSSSRARPGPGGPRSCSP